MSNRLRTLAGVGAVLALGASACNNDKLTEVNQNPNDPTDAPTATLFTSAVRNGVGRWLDGVNGTRYGFLPQHLAEVQYPDDDTYLRLKASSTSGMFNAAYNVELQDFELVLNRGTAATQPGTSGPAQIMKAWEIGIITDSWGDIPYSQAFRADSGVLNPTYDAQKDIYTDLFAKLGAASSSLSSASNTLGSADPIYAGNPAQWQKFANSVRARHALRVVNVDPATASSQLQAAFTATGGLIASNADNAKMAWPGDGVYDNPWATSFKGRDDYRVSDDLIIALRANKDPRISVLAQRAEVDAPETPNRSTKWCPDATTPCYVGLANALTQATASPLIAYTSRLGAIFYPGATAYGTFGGAGGKYPSYLMTAAEAFFIRAEAAQRGLGGLAPAAAAGYYGQGIRANMEMLGVASADIDTYLAQPSVAYAGGTPGLQQIAQQKWIALIIDPLNAWAEVRRTCSPGTIKPGPSAVEAVLPRRFYYSTGEAATNSVALKEAVARQGADNFKTRIYWDKSPTAAPTYVAGCNTR